MVLMRIGTGNKYKVAWRQFCDEIGAEYVDGDLLSEDHIVANFNVWTIFFNVSIVKYNKYGGPGLTIRRTQINAPFIRNGDDWWFKVYRTTFLTSLAQIFGIYWIQVGEPEFDQAFILKSNDERKAQALFGNQHIQKLLKAQITNWNSLGSHLDKIAPKPFHPFIKSGWFDPTFRLEIKKYKKNVNLLYFEQDTLITGIQQLKSIYELFGEVLTQLCELELAAETDPDDLLYR